MTAHHEDATGHIRFMAGQLGRSEVLQLAQQIIVAQGNEVQQMQPWRTQWFPQASYSTLSGKNHAHPSPNADPDRDFLQAMIPQHEMGVQMARDALNNIQRPELQQFAQHIIDKQTTEVAQMRQLLGQR